MRFTDVSAAIEEAVYLADTTKKVYVVALIDTESVEVMSDCDAVKNKRIALERFWPCNT